MKRKMWLVASLPIMALALAALLLQPLAAGAANGGHIHFLGTKKAAIRAAGGNLTYHGGPIMPHSTQAYAIFWEPTGSYVSPTYNSLILRYFGDVGGSKLYHNNTQYKGTNGAPSGSTLGGSWVDTAAYPSKNLTDKQVQNEVTHAMSTNGWTASLDHIFFVFTAKNENICYGSQCSFSVFCAYHSYFGAKSIYAAMPYTGTNLSACGAPSSPNKDIDADSTINVTSHEQMEAATDPLISAWYDSTGAEIGDKCAWKFGPIGTSGGDVTWNGHHYIVQKEWDNAKKGCVLAGP